MSETTRNLNDSPGSPTPNKKLVQTKSWLTRLSAWLIIMTQFSRTTDRLPLILRAKKWCAAPCLRTRHMLIFFYGSRCQAGGRQPRSTCAQLFARYARALRPYPLACAQQHGEPAAHKGIGKLGVFAGAQFFARASGKLRGAFSPPPRCHAASCSQLFLLGRSRLPLAAARCCCCCSLLSHSTVLDSRAMQTSTAAEA